MKKHLVVGAAIVGLMLSSVAAGGVGAQEADEEAVREAAAGFYAALNAMFSGDVGPMTEVWSHADDVTYLGPVGGILVGWPDVLASWQAQADMNLGGEVTPGELHVTVGSDLAVVQNLEVGSNTVDDSPMEVSIRATHVFRKEGGEWKMISHHTDLLAQLEQ